LVALVALAATDMLLFTLGNHCTKHTKQVKSTHYGKISSMDSKRREEPQRRLERQGSGFLQRSESRETGVEAPPARGRQQARLFLRPYGRDEEEINERKNRQGSKFED
jgi:hypothetical protein